MQYQRYSPPAIVDMRQSLSWWRQSKGRTRQKWLERESAALVVIEETAAEKRPSCSFFSLSLFSFVLNILYAYFRLNRFINQII